MNPIPLHKPRGIRTNTVTGTEEGRCRTCLQWRPLVGFVGGSCARCERSTKPKPPYGGEAA